MLKFLSFLPKGVCVFVCERETETQRERETEREH